MLVVGACSALVARPVRSDCWVEDDGVGRWSVVRVGGNVGSSISIAVEEDEGIGGMEEGEFVPVVERACGMEGVDSELVEDCCWTVRKYLLRKRLSSSVPMGGTGSQAVTVAPSSESCQRERPLRARNASLGVKTAAAPLLA